MRVPTHPGEILRDELEARGMSANRLALDLGVPVTRVAEILQCRRRVTPETALRLARYFGGAPEFWMNLQTHHDLGIARRDLGREIERTVRRAA